MARLELKVITARKTYSLKASSGQTLAEALAEAGLPLRLYCQGRGVCGRCFVEVKDGRCSEAGPVEKKLRDDRKLPTRFRLACQLELNGPMTVRIPETSLLFPETRELTRSPSALENYLPGDFNPLVKKYVLSLSSEDLSRPPGLAVKIKSLLRLKELAFSPTARRKLETKTGLSRKVTAVVYEDRLLLDLEAGHTADRIFALAVDLGTTSVSARLLDLSQGQTLAAASSVNLQAAHGADLISRLSFAAEKPGNRERLRQAALESIERLTEELCAKTGLKRKWIYAVGLAGNAVMNHLFLNQQVDSLSRAPFQPAFLVREPIPASEAKLKINPGAMVYLSPNLGGFVGGDVSAGLLYTGLVDRPGNYLFVDLGTNGEIVLKKGQNILAASTAAGPAFEGGGISCGLQAVAGAVEHVKWSGARFIYRTIGRRKPAGLCGSGLLGVLAESLKTGRLHPSGRIAGGRASIDLTGKLALNQVDVRKLQLALAAVKSGIKLLLQVAGLDWQELDALYLAGVFGNSVDPGQCLAVGLLPPLPRRKIVFAGNTSLAGAGLLLLSSEARQAAAKLPGRVQPVSLAGMANFQTEFLAALALGRGYWRRTDV